MLDVVVALGLVPRASAKAVSVRGDGGGCGTSAVEVA